MPSFPSQSPKDEYSSHALLWLCRGQDMEQNRFLLPGTEIPVVGNRGLPPPQRTLVPHAAHLSHMSKFVLTENHRH